MFYDVFLIAPSKPTIDAPEKGKVIPVSDTTPVTMYVGDNITALTNNTVRIKCPVSGFPKPRLTWTRDGEEITSGGRYNIDDSGTLSVSQLNKGDYSRFTCRAQSKLGEDSRTSTVGIVGESNRKHSFGNIFFFDRNVQCSRFCPKAFFVFILY